MTLACQSVAATGARASAVTDCTELTYAHTLAAAESITVLPLLSRMPLEPPQGNPSLRVELHALDLEPDALLHVSFRNYLAETEPAPRIDHPVPRYARMRGQRIQGIAYVARVPGKTSERGHLAIGGDAARRDSKDNRIDTFVSAFALHLIPLGQWPSIS
jgi:hypothetical protein